MHIEFKVSKIEDLDVEKVQQRLRECVVSEGELYAIREVDRFSSTGGIRIFGLKDHTTTGVRFAYDCGDDGSIDRMVCVDSSDPKDNIGSDYCGLTIIISEYACREDVVVGIALLGVLRELYSDCLIQCMDNWEDYVEDYLYDDVRGDIIELDKLTVEQESEERSVSLYLRVLTNNSCIFEAVYNGYKKIQASQCGLDLSVENPVESTRRLWDTLTKLSCMDAWQVFIPDDRSVEVKEVDGSIRCPHFYNHADTLVQGQQRLVCLVCGSRRKVVRADVLRERLGDKVKYPATCKEYFIIPQMEMSEYRVLFDACTGFDVNDCRVFLMRWNPEISDFKLSKFQRITAQEYLDACMRWAVTDWEDIRVDDYALLACVGMGENDGLVAGGTIGTLPKKGRDWADKTKQRFYVRFDLNMAIEPGSEYEIKAPKLEQIASGIDWHGGHSGVRVPEEYASVLVGLWEHHRLQYGLQGLGYTSLRIAIS